MRLIASGVFLIVAFAVTAVLSAAFPGDAGLLIRVPLVVLLSFVSILFHELGHAIVAQALGGHIREVVVLPFAWRPGTRRLRTRWRAPGSEVGGYVAYTLDRIDARRKHMLIALAGPAASLLLAAAAGVLAHSLEKGPAVNQSTVAAALAILSGGIGVANLLPFDGSDGAQILRRLYPRRAR